MITTSEVHRGHARYSQELIPLLVHGAKVRDRRLYGSESLAERRTAAMVAAADTASARAARDAVPSCEAALEAHLLRLQEGQARKAKRLGAAAAAEAPPSTRERLVECRPRRVVSCRCGPAVGGADRAPAGPPGDRDG